jgi:nicotinamidase-related amidase
METKMTKNVHLLIIDPQNDFCAPEGALSVPGADEDMFNLSTFIELNLDKIDQIHVTLDTHHTVDISHPIWWQNENGEEPAPFTIITPESIESGEWKAKISQLQTRSADYVKTLAETSKNPLCIWPYHCLEGTWGHGVYDNLNVVLRQWEQNFKRVNFVRKGLNMWTEHYSAIKADVPDPNDPDTQVNKNLVDILKYDADLVLVAGEASSHCVANTVIDLINQFDDERFNAKVAYLDDCCSAVPGFENLEVDFIKEIEDRGVLITNSKRVVDIL